MTVNGTKPTLRAPQFTQLNLSANDSFRPKAAIRQAQKTPLSGGA